jgi:hypothetical protein
LRIMWFDLVTTGSLIMLGSAYSMAAKFIGLLMLRRPSKLEELLVLKITTTH